MKEDDAAEKLAALAQDSRLAVYRALVQAGPEGLAAGAIATRLGIAASTLSFHLKTLSHAGLVTIQPLGRSKIYRADYAAMNGLVGYLTENCCGGAECASVPRRRAAHR